MLAIDYGINYGSDKKQVEAEESASMQLTYATIVNKQEEIIKSLRTYQSQRERSESEF